MFFKQAYFLRNVHFFHAITFAQVTPLNLTISPFPHCLSSTSLKLEVFSGPLTGDQVAYFATTCKIRTAQEYIERWQTEIKGCHF